MTEIEVDLAALEFHQMNPPVGASVGQLFEVRARLLDDIADLFGEVKRLRLEATRVGLVAARTLADKYNAIEHAS